MKLMSFCNLVPRKIGAFESLLIAVGKECTANGDSSVVVFSAAPPDNLARELQGVGVGWRVIEGWDDGGGKVRPWAFCLPALRLLRQEKPDVVAVHFGNELPTIAVRLLAWLTIRRRCRWVWHQRQQIRSPGLIASRISRLRLLSLAMARLVACYDGGRKSMLLRGISENRISVIHNAIDEYVPGTDRVRIRDEIKVSEDALLLVNVGWLVERKRVHLSIRAFATATADIDRETHLLIVGSGPEETKLRALVDELSQGKQVHFLGERHDVRDILSESDVLIHSSEAEASANIVQEAMSVSVPTVMMDAGAAREQIEDGVSGFVVDRDDTACLAERLRMLVQDDELRTGMGKKARKRWQAMFQLSASAAAHHRLCRDVAEG